MRTLTAFALLAAAASGWARADDLPAEARQVLDDLEREAEAIRKKADDAIAARAAAAAERLDALQSKYQQDKRFDDARAVLRVIRELNKLPVADVGPAGGGHQPDVGQRVEVRWSDKWWRAEVRDAKDGQYLIHYTDWGTEYDEWVAPDRIRRPTAPKPVAGQVPVD